MNRLPATGDGLRYLHVRGVPETPTLHSRSALRHVSWHINNDDWNQTARGWGPSQAGDVW